MMFSLLVISAISTIIFMTAIFILSEYKKDASIVDIFWGIGIIFIALLCVFYAQTYTPRQLLVTWLILIWGTRLSFQIFLRKRGKHEDPRYQAWREQWGTNYRVYSYIYIFLVQALAMIIVSYPIILINGYYTQAHVGPLDILGLLVWVIGFAFEVIGDWQLYSFLKKDENKGKIMQSGLWRYSRHPNYFGESLMWWGIFIIALSSPYGFTAIISPLTITYLLLFVSGIPLAEQQLAANPEFANYKWKTSAFFPLPP